MSYIHHSIHTRDDVIYEISIGEPVDCKGEQHYLALFLKPLLKDHDDLGITKYTDFMPIFKKFNIRKSKVINAIATDFKDYLSSKYENDSMNWLKPRYLLKANFGMKNLLISDYVFKYNTPFFDFLNATSSLNIINETQKKDFISMIQTEYEKAKSNITYSQFQELSFDPVTEIQNNKNNATVKSNEKEDSATMFVSESEEPTFQNNNNTNFDDGESNDAFTDNDRIDSFLQLNAEMNEPHEFSYDIYFNNGLDSFEYENM